MLGNTASPRNAYRLFTTRLLGPRIRHMQLSCNSIVSYADSQCRLCSKWLALAPLNRSLEALQILSCLLYNAILSWHYAKQVSYLFGAEFAEAGFEFYGFTDLLYLHRSFFARAVNDHPADPLGSPYGTSVIAAYRSAGSLVAMMRNLHGQLGELSERIWFMWAHMFSCAVSCRVCYTNDIDLTVGTTDRLRLYCDTMSIDEPRSICAVAT